jgi:glutamyl/glutaminyl-tRNA synthetase
MVNRWEATQGAGRFYVRFDDTQRCWNDRMSFLDRIKLKDSWVDDLEWLEIQVDGFWYQSEMEHEARKLLAMHCAQAHIPMPVDYYDEQLFPDVVASCQAYPYSPYKTAEKVIFDRMMEITQLIRGEDLIDEFSLYCYYSDMFRIHQPVHTYLPRLRVKGRLELSDVSKSKSNFKIQDLRKNGSYTATILDVLAQGCLIDPSQGWRIENIRPQPEITEEEWV